MTVVVVGAPGCLASAFLGTLDLLSISQWAIADASGDGATFAVVSASSDGCAIRDGQGRRLEVDHAFDEISSCTAVIVPGFVPDATRRPPLLTGLGGAAAWLHRQHARGALVCGSCSGTFLLGEARLLDGRRCTTTWWLHDELKRRYPRADAAWGAPLIEDRRVVSAGGPLSWVDIVLYVIRSLYGIEIARLAADFAVVDAAPSAEAAYRPTAHLSASGPFLVEAERIVRHAGHEPVSARELARRMAVSERTLHRRLRQACGESPKQLIDRVHFEMARTLLETSNKPIKEIAANASYSDESSFRRTFKRLSGMTPSAYRIWSGRRRQIFEQ